MAIRHEDRSGLWVALLADVVRSRAIADREALLDTLKEALAKVAAEAPVEDAVAAGPDVAAGDEAEILLRAGPGAGAAAMAFVARLTEELRPVRAAFGIGIGDLTTSLDRPIREADGTCFHRARAAVEEAKTAGRWAIVRGLSPTDELAANALLRLTGDLRAAWTDRQCQVIATLRTVDLQKDAARRLGVSPSVVSEVLQAARHDAVRQAEDAVAALLDDAS